MPPSPESTALPWPGKRVSLPSIPGHERQSSIAARTRTVTSVAVAFQANGKEISTSGYDVIRTANSRRSGVATIQPSKPFWRCRPAATTAASSSALRSRGMLSESKIVMGTNHDSRTSGHPFTGDKPALPAPPPNGVAPQSSQRKVLPPPPPPDGAVRQPRRRPGTAIPALSYPGEAVRAASATARRRDNRYRERLARRPIDIGRPQGEAERPRRQWRAGDAPYIATHVGQNQTRGQRAGNHGVSGGGRRRSQIPVLRIGDACSPARERETRPDRAHSDGWGSQYSVGVQFRDVDARRGRQHGVTHQLRDVDAGIDGHYATDLALSCSAVISATVNATPVTGFTRSNDSYVA